MSLPHKPAIPAAGVASDSRAHTLWYNFARINSAVRMPPAMAARLTEKLWNISDIVKPVEESEA